MSPTDRITTPFSAESAAADVIAGIDLSGTRAIVCASDQTAIENVMIRVSPMRSISHPATGAITAYTMEKTETISPY